MSEKLARALTWLAGIIAVVCLVWLLRTAAVVFMPLAAAFFVAIAVHPVQVVLRERVPERPWVGVALSMALIVGILGGAIWATAEAVDEAVEAAPRYTDRLEASWHDLQRSARAYGVPWPSDLQSTSSLRDRLGGVATSAVRTTWEIVSGLVLVLFLVLLMLLEAPIWSDNTRRVLHERYGGAALATVGEIADKVRGYLWIRTLLGLMSAVAAAAWLLLMDVDLVLVWVVLTLALNYIPNIGSIIAVFPPSAMALVQHGPVHALITLGGLTVIEQIIGNFIDPRMQGRRLQVSPVLVLVALVFWTWMWGPVGALLAVPMTVMLLAAAAHVPALRPAVTLLAAERRTSS